LGDRRDLTAKYIRLVDRTGVRGAFTVVGEVCKKPHYAISTTDSKIIGEDSLGIRNGRISTSLEEESDGGVMAEEGSNKEGSRAIFSTVVDGCTGSEEETHTF